MVHMKFEWKWCYLCGLYIECPKCGNNGCSGGYGEIDGQKCDVCPQAYDYQRTAPKPTKEETIKLILDEIQECLKGICTCDDDTLTKIFRTCPSCMIRKYVDQAVEELNK